MSNKFLNNLSKIIIAIAIISGIVFAIYIFLSKSQAETIETKGKEEIAYLDTKLLSIINKLNNIELQNYKVTLSKLETNDTSSKNTTDEATEESKSETNVTKMEKETIVTDENTTDWETIEEELELVSSTWPSIVLDLYKLETNSEDILNFSDDLNETISYIKKQDKVMTSMYLAKLYSYLPKFLEKTGTEEIKRETIEAKTYIVNAYANAQNNNWDKMNTEIQKAETIFTSLINDARYVNDSRKYNINKAYILIGELKKSLSLKNTGIFYLKYKNTLEGLNILS